MPILPLSMPQAAERRAQAEAAEVGGKAVANCGCLGFRVLGFRVWGFRVWGLGFGVLGFWGFGFRVGGLGFRD